MNRSTSEATPDTQAVPRLTDLVDLEILQSLQDGFARLTGISTSIRDAEGRAVTEPAERSSFCALVQSTPPGAEACWQSHSEAARLVREVDLPCRNECHAGLAQFVAPIIVGDQHLGEIIVGDRPRSALAPDKLKELAGRLELDQGQLSAAAKGLTPWSDEQMVGATAFVQQLANTIAQLCYQAHQLQRRIDELAVVHEVATMLAGKVKLQDVLDTATQQLVTTMGLRASVIRLLDDDSGILRLASVAGLSKEYLDKGQVLAMDSPIDQSALAGQTVYIEDLRTDPRVFHRGKARKEGLISALVTGVSLGGRRIGVIRAYMGRLHRFTPFEISLLEAIASQIAAAIVNARLTRDMAEAARLERQIKLAADVQRRMIPSRPPSHAHYELATVYEPSFDLGGDFYDFIAFDNKDLGVVIADVVGKGVPASLMMASVRSSLRSHARRVTDISDIIQSVNRRLCHDTLTGEFVTAFYVELSADGKRMKYCNAGHEPLLLLRDGEITELDVGGIVLGIEEEAVYQSAEIELRPGDLMIVFTDGMLEALNYEGQSYGRRRLHDSLRLHGSMSPDMPVSLIAKQLLWDVRRFAGLAPVTDDITLVIARVKD